MISKMKPPEEGGTRLAIVLKRLTAIHRVGRIWRKRDPTLDH